MKLPSKLSSVIAIFFSGWLMGILFSYIKLTTYQNESLLSHDERGGSISNSENHNGNSYFLRRNSYSSSPEDAVLFEEEGGDTITQAVPSSSSSSLSNDDTGDDLNVFLFWPYDNRLLSRANYESLETILESYPRALVRTLAFANDDKMRAHFGFFPNQFSKYQKLG